MNSSNAKDYDKIHYYASVFMFLFINNLFIIKYLSRISSVGAISTGIVYSAASIWAMIKRPDISVKWSKIIIFIGCITLLSLLFALRFIPVESLNVDRWEIIDLFWHSIEKGLYPYQQQTAGGNNIGAMPMYFMAYYPFYLIRELALFLLLLSAAGIFIIYRLTGIKTAAVAAALIIVSPSFYWEVTTRSTIIVNSTIFFAFFLMMRDFFTCGTKKLFFLALIGGLIFSMRNTFAIPLMVWGVAALKNYPRQWKKTVTWTFLFVLCFALTFLPLIVTWGDVFWNHNPFIVQSGELMPMWLIIAFVAVAAFLGLCCRNFEQTIWYAGLSLFLLILGYSINFIFNEGFEASFWQNKIDISYYLFAYPFIIYEIVGYWKKHSIE